MRRTFTALFLGLAILSGIVGTASGAYVDATSKNRVGVPGPNPDIRTYVLGSLEQEPQVGDTIVGYDSATGVVFYVNQNPWTHFDPLGLHGYPVMTGDTAARYQEYSNSPEAAKTEAMVFGGFVALHVGGAVAVKMGVVGVIKEAGCEIFEHYTGIPTGLKDVPGLLKKGWKAATDLLKKGDSSPSGPSAQDVVEKKVLNLGAGDNPMPNATNIDLDP